MKVFLSSTYSDLIEHRKAAHDALEQLGLHVIWMEAFGARPEESTRACLAEIEACDLFVGIYAHRYGYIPAGAERSITEQEFDHARKLGKPIFAFIVHEEHPWPPKHIEHDKRASLDAFLGKVRKQPVEFFTTPDNLAQNIASSVGRYLSEINFNRQSSIENRQSQIVNPKSQNTLPRLGFFIGREKELQTIAEALSPDSRTWGALIDEPGGVGNAQCQLGNYDAALSAFQRAIELSGLDDHKFASLYNSIGNVYSDLKQYDAALAAYQRAIELGPKDAYPHNGIGIVYQFMDEPQKALQAHQKAVELAPDSGTNRSSLVGILRKLGREQEAQAQIEIARPLMAKESEYDRACFEAICGNVDEALRLLQIALEKKQVSLEWARRDPDFDAIRDDPRFQALLGNG